MEPVILYEDNHLLAINKPAGWLVQGDKTGDATLTDWGKAYLKEKYNKPGAVFLHPVHRIDRPVSGLVLFARTDKALSRLTTMFRERKVAKSYLALCTIQPQNATETLHHFLIKDEALNQSRVCKPNEKGAKEAVLRYETMGALGVNFLLRVFPQTGRPHQIRVQLSAIGCPILGDLKYNAPKALPDASIGLHSWELSFIHPVKQTAETLRAPVPAKPWWKDVEAALTA